MSKKRRRPEEEETSYWLSYSDMMAALLLIFILIISFTLMQSKSQYESKQAELDKQKEIIKEQEQLLKDQQEELDRIAGIRSDLVAALRDEFADSSLNVKVDEKTGAITFDASVLFDVADSDLKEEGKTFLKEFLPKYCNVLLDEKYRDYVSEIIIEGHTDTNGSYIYNLELSQQRAFSVAKYCLTESNGIISSTDVELLRSVLTANGKSYSNPIYKEDGSVDLEASRRVEILFRLQDEEMIAEMMDILKEKSITFCVQLAPVPAITGICPAVSSTTHFITESFSSSVIVAGSPVVPHTIIASVPPSICLLTSVLSIS